MYNLVLWFLWKNQVWLYRPLLQTGAVDRSWVVTVPLTQDTHFPGHYSPPPLRLPHCWPSFTHLAYWPGPADISCRDSSHTGFMGMCGDKQMTELPSEQNCKCTLYRNISSYCTSLNFTHIAFSWMEVLSQSCVKQSPFSQQHLLTSDLCNILGICTIFQTFCYYSICCGDLWCYYCCLGATWATPI